MSDGDTVGIWIGKDEDLIERFDDELGTDDPGYSRSNEIKNAMELYLGIEDALDDVDYEFPTDRDKRRWVRQAVFDQARREAGPE